MRKTRPIELPEQISPEACSQPHHPPFTECNNFIQLPELSSLSNEFMSTILTTTPTCQPQPNTSSQSLQHESNFMNNVNEARVCTIASTTAVAPIIDTEVSQALLTSPFEESTQGNNKKQYYALGSKK